MFWFKSYSFQPISETVAEKSPETVDDWLQSIKGSKNARDLLPCLQSSLSTDAKHRVLNRIDTRIYDDRHDIEYVENQIKDSEPSLVQSLRWGLYWTQYNTDESRKWCHDAVALNIQGRWIVQREIYVSEELKAMSKSTQLCPSDSEASKIEVYEGELDRLNKQYVEYDRKRGALHLNIPLGPLSRAFKAYREGKMWYLTHWLERDCAERGGCCGRECGCCEKPRDTQRKLSHGHCTSACGCCIRTRRFYSGEFTDLEDYPFDLIANNSPYSVRINFAYIWGLALVD